MNKITFNTTTKLFTLVALALFTFSFTSSTRVTFREWEWKSVKEAAGMYHRPIVLFVYSNTCNESKNTYSEFNTKSTSEFYNKNFLCCKMNATKMLQAMKAQNMGVRAVPTIMYFSATGKLMHTIAGYQSRAQLLNAGQLAKTVITETAAKEKATAIAKANSYKAKS